MASNELADWMETRNIPALLIHYMHNVKNHRHYEPFRGFIQTGVATVKITLDGRSLKMEATETFEEDFRSVQNQLEQANNTIREQEKQIKTLEKEVAATKPEIHQETKKKATKKKVRKVVETPVEAQPIYNYVTPPSIEE